MITEHKVQFRQWKCLLDVARYWNDRIALRLIDITNGEPIATATVNVSEAKLERDEVLIKDWSENEGMLDAMTAAGIVTPTGRLVPSGYVYAHVCKLRPGIVPEAIADLDTAKPTPAEAEAELDKALDAAAKPTYPTEGPYQVERGELQTLQQVEYRVAFHPPSEAGKRTLDQAWWGEPSDKDGPPDDAEMEAISLAEGLNCAWLSGYCQALADHGMEIPEHLLPYAPYKADEDEGPLF